MKKQFYYTTFIFLIFLYSCEDKVTTIVGTKWQTINKEMVFEFVSDSVCKMMLHPEQNNNSNSAFGNYHYEKPNITITSPPSNGFGSYIGTITETKMTIKRKDSDSDALVFNKITIVVR